MWKGAMWNPMWNKVCVVVGAPLAVFATALAGHRLVAPGDAYSLILPQHVLAGRLLRAGEFPVLNAFRFAGYPLLGASQAGVFYPPNWLFVFLPAVLATNLNVVITFVVASLGAFVLSRRLCHDDVGAMVSGLAFGLSGYLFAHLVHENVIAGVAWLPWVLYFFELCLDRLTPRRVFLGGATLALVLFTGHSQTFFIVVLVLGVYASTLAALGFGRSFGRPLLVAAVLLAVGLGLSGVQLVSTAAIVGDSSRSTVDYKTATSFSMPGSHTPLVVFPFLFGNKGSSGPFDGPYQGRWNLPEMSAYPGMVALVLAGAGVAAARRNRRVIAIVIVALVALLVALGSSTPFGQVVYAVPLYGRFRAWARYLVGIDLAVSMLAGYGVAALRSGVTSRKRDARKGAVVVAGIVALLAIAVPQLGPVKPFLSRGSTRLFALVVPVVAAAAGVVLCLLVGRLLPGRARRAATTVLVLAVAGDALLSFGGWLEWRTASPSPAELRAALSRDTPPQIGAVGSPDGGLVRTVYVGNAFGKVAMLNDELKGVRSANGNDPLAPSRYVEALTMQTRGVVNDPRSLVAPPAHVLDLLRVGVVLDDAQRPRAGLSGGHRVADGHLVRFDRRPSLPDAFVVGEVKRVSEAKAMRGLAGVTPFAPDATVLIEEACRRCAPADRPGRAGRVTATSWSRQSMRADVTVDRPGMLVVSQAWFPGWTATVDGRRAQVLRADGLVLGVPVQPGRHHVTLRYHAPGLAAGALLSLATALGLTGWAVLATVARRRRVERSPGADREKMVG